jgi:hypothetical protein
LELALAEVRGEASNQLTGGAVQPIKTGAQIETGESWIWEWA